ncbi:hypothetical protein FZI91_03410 [Mycobacterium sp. CBMA271]|uniref:WXG100 family type VII secretion target n=1 Tax=unclassified Mycobacteroides TaxID=2618759 RepID=UPI0012DDFEA8|nr:MULTISPECIES: WXG100 family type VII secretion target [unclassified Mycobacteroides]MUM18168.1 hypothetical protein [Mycobacteroides sp. CBMA 326]MUM20754.1 hypothetical protein [Mycobacteroides sp. CBMA 271]
MVTYNHGEIATLVSSLRSIGQKYEEALGGLQSDVAPLINEHEGVDADAYHGFQQQWQKQAQEVHETVAFYTNAIEQADHDAQQTDKTNAGRWG